MRHKDCIFCQIVHKEANAFYIHQDDLVTAFMDIHPINPGHVLVIPNVHTPDLAGLEAACGARIFTVGQRIAAALRGSELRADGVNFLLADGAAAGQEVFHLHLHVLARYEGDGFGFRRSGQIQREKQDLEGIAGMLRSVLE
ncbi:MAG: HIT family protein [Anaerolineales bacterium]|nr:HIT family protein [Anaerolineales bacterium]